VAMRNVLAVDLGGTKTAIARVDEDGTVRDRRVAPAAHTLDGSVDQIAGAARGCGAIGVIVPGIDEYARRWFERGPDPVVRDPQ